MINRRFLKINVKRACLPVTDAEKMRSWEGGILNRRQIRGMPFTADGFEGCFTAPFE
jgi:hypothetical protein